MIRSSKVSLKFSNKGKLDSLASVIEEGNRVIRFFIDTLWEMGYVPTLLPRSVTSKCKTWLSARMIQSLGKQASGIVRSSKTKQQKREWILNKMKKEGKDTTRLEANYSKNPANKPSLSEVIPLELDRRFVSVELTQTNHFDGWVTLGSLGRKLKLILPFKRTKHLNRLLQCGEIKTGARLTASSVTFILDLEPEENKGVETLGIDIGISKLVSLSSGGVNLVNKHGYDLKRIMRGMIQKKKGSKSYQRAQTHRKNHINWVINQLNLSQVKQVNIENIKHLFNGRKSTHLLRRWVYRDILNKLERRCEEYGVHVLRIDPAYTSQRCFVCGWVWKGNRKGSSFRCSKCGYSTDADQNGAQNIALALSGISPEMRAKRLNLQGFYYLLGREPIVPDTLENKFHENL